MLICLFIKLQMDRPVVSFRDTTRDTKQHLRGLFEMNDVTSFGEWVRQQRKKLNLTQAALAERVGCAVVTIKKIEQDERRPSPQIADLLADCLAIAEPDRSKFMRMARRQFVPLPASGKELPPPPPFLGEAVKPPPPDQSPFVAREPELARLDGYLRKALAREGGVAFVTGEAGYGKTALLLEFARLAQNNQPDLIVAQGNCNAHAGVGDPYLPFRDVLGMLTGDLEARWRAGTISKSQLLRLWNLVPDSLEALTTHGAQLIDTLVPGGPLLQRVKTGHLLGPDEFTRLYSLVEQQRSPTPRERSQLLEQVTQVLRSLASRHPLLLLLDDLQWLDDASNNLLFHLGRRLAGSRILLVGAYRPSGVNESHPLTPVITEFQRRLGDIQLDLEQFDLRAGRSFVEALLDTEANHLSEQFRERLFWHTKGHPLFTIELLQDMQERGDLVQDEAGYWVEGQTLEWNTLPVRVEAVIKQRIERLDPGLQELLTIASVEGELFTAEVVARVQQVNEREVVRRLSQELDRQHRLVAPQALESVGQQRLSFYRFRHHLFQHYLYQRLDKLERTYLHEAVGHGLEALYGAQTETLTIQLARHFQEAGLVTKAITYLGQAADRARQLFALAEALQFYSQAIELAQAHPQAIEPLFRLDLYERRGETYSLAGNFNRAVADLQLIRQAAEEAGDTQRERVLLIRLGQVYRKTENAEIATRYLHQALEAARAVSDQRAVADTLYHLGAVSWDQGHNKQARRYHQEAVEICHSLNLNDIVALQAYHGLGEAAFVSAQPELAIDYYQRSLALAHQLGDRGYESENMLMIAFASLGSFGDGNYRRAQEFADKSLAISDAAHLEWHTMCNLIGRGLALGCVGNYQSGLDNVAEGLKRAQDLNLARFISFAMDSLGYLWQDLNLLEQAKAIHAQGLETSLRAESAFWLPRLQANLAIDRLRLGDRQNVERDLQAALSLAQENGQEHHLIRCLEGLTECSLVLGNLEPALKYADALLGLAETRKLNEIAAQAHRWRGEIMLAAGQLDPAETELNRAAALAVEIGRVRLRWDVHAALGRLYEQQGQVELVHQHETIVQTLVAQISENLQQAQWRAGLPVTDPLSTDQR